MTSSGRSSLEVWKHRRELEELRRECEEKEQEQELSIMSASLQASTSPNPWMSCDSLGVLWLFN